MGFATTSGRPLAGANTRSRKPMRRSRRSRRRRRCSRTPPRTVTRRRSMSPSPAEGGAGRGRAGPGRGARARTAGSGVHRARAGTGGSGEASRLPAMGRRVGSARRPDRRAPRAAHRGGSALAALGLRPSPFRNRSEAVDAGLYAGMPDGVQACARAIPDARGCRLTSLARPGAAIPATRWWSSASPVMTAMNGSRTRSTSWPTTWKRAPRDAPRSAAGRRGQGRRMDRPGVAHAWLWDEEAETHRGPGETISLLVADVADLWAPTHAAIIEQRGRLAATWTPRGRGCVRPSTTSTSCRRGGCLMARRAGCSTGSSCITGPPA